MTRKKERLRKKILLTMKLRKRDRVDDQNVQNSVPIVDFAGLL